MATHTGDCSKCPRRGVKITYRYTNPRHCLCDECDIARIRNRNALKARNKARKSYHKGGTRKPLKRAPISKSPTKARVSLLKEDERINRGIWRDRKHVCFECDSAIPPGIDSKGQPTVPAKAVFSHVHSKGARPDLRHVKENIVLHCPEPCHQTWEGGKRESMPRTSALFERLGEKYPDNKHGRETVEKGTVD